MPGLLAAAASSLRNPLLTLSCALRPLAPSSALPAFFHRERRRSLAAADTLLKGGGAALTGTEREREIRVEWRLQMFGPSTLAH